MKEIGVAEILLKNLKAKYRGLNQVYDLTKELDQVLRSGDESSVEMVLEMRRKQLELCVRMDQENEKLADQLPEPERARALGLVFTRGEYTEPENDLEEQLLNLAKSIQRVKTRTMEFDNEIRQRLEK